MDLKWPLRIMEARLDGVLVLALTGRLGATSAGVLDAAVAQAVGRGDVRVVIDLAAVDYVSSAGLNALASASALCARARGALVLCGLADPVTIALGLGGLIPEVPVETSRDQAVVRVTSSCWPGKFI
jgi:stage II sporulation protein AA (anti-sigma F factor antagonist)